MRYLTEFFNSDKAYFINSKQAITGHNRRTLVDGCLLYGVVLTFYTLLSLVTEQPIMLRNMYFVYDGLHGLLCLAVFAGPAGWKNSYKITQFLSGVFIILILSFFALEGALVTPTQHSLYIPIAILLVLLLFINRAAHSFLLIFLYTGSFALLAWLNKTPQAAINDLYIALGSFIASNIGYVLISNLRRSEQQAILKLEEINKTDSLTGLYNKAATEQLCQNHISMNTKSCAVVVIDLDDFKNVNDTFGHEAGDEVLKAFGEIIKSAFCAADITGRFGGDEFVVLMDCCDNWDTVLDKINAMQNKLCETRFTVPEISVSCSVGVAFSSGNESFNAVFSRADRALYEAKHNKKNGVCLAAPPVYQ